MARPDFLPQSHTLITSLGSLNLRERILLRLLVCCLLLCTSVCASAQNLPPTQSVFQANVQAAISGQKPVSVVNLTANAEWFAGSTHETGTAQLQAKADGATSVQLVLGQGSRLETQTKIDSSRTCAWTDNAGISHDILGANCFVAIPWFAPNLFAQPASLLPVLLATTDDGEVSKDGVAFHQLRYFLNLQAADSISSKRAVDHSAVKVFYDPRTFLPVSLEFAAHPDTNDLQNIDVEVKFSNYQSVSGVLLPFHIEKYVQHTLQLKMDVSNASIE